MDRLCIILIALSLSLFSRLTSADNQIDFDHVVAEFNDLFSRQVEEYDYPAAAHAIVTRDQILSLGVKGHTDSSRQQAINTDTVFRLASVSKTFAAQAITSLADQGAFDLDDPVARFVPEFALKGSSSGIQLQHLLDHSSGIMPHAYDNLIEDGVDNSRILYKLGELEPICQPGKCYGYQNFVFSLVAPAAEQATRLSYSELVEQRIFSPLEMKNASIGLEPLVSNPNHARPHVRSRGQWKRVSVLPNYYQVAPAAGVNASISDVALWLQAHLGARPDVIPDRLVEQVSTPRVKTRRELYRKHWNQIVTDAHYGLGWRVYQLGDEVIVYHSGWVRGYRADVAFSVRHNVGIAVLLNTEGNSISKMSSGFWKLVLEQLAES